MIKFNAPKLKLFSLNNIDQLEQFKMLKVMQKHSAYLSFAGKGLLLVKQ